LLHELSTKVDGEKNNLEDCLIDWLVNVLRIDKKVIRRRGLNGLQLALVLLLSGSPISAAVINQTVPEHSPASMSFSAMDPIFLYGDSIIFDAYRKGKFVGTHEVGFRRERDQIEVRSLFKLKIKLLFITAYRFQYESIGRWKNGKCISLVAKTNDNGRESNVEAVLDGGRLLVDGPQGRELATHWVYPTNHWNAGVLEVGTVLNTITGHLSDVEIVSRGIDQVDTVAGPVKAEHFEYTGELHDTHVWYDSVGHWVKLVFKARDGSDIEYRCRSCGILKTFRQDTYND